MIGWSMLIDFTFENFLSFKDESKFSMIKTLERHHANHIIDIKKYNLKLLPIAAIFGGNASGKSNFVKALAVMREIVLQNIGPNFYKDNYFALDQESGEKKIKFKIRLLVNDIIYEYFFSILKEEIATEYLKKLTPSKEIELFKRSPKEGIRCSEEIFKKNKVSNIWNHLEVNAKGTKKNQLFLNNVYSQNEEAKIDALKDFMDVYKWFRYQLYCVGPNSLFQKNPFDKLFTEEMNKLIPLFDLGFYKGKAIENPIEEDKGLYDMLFKEISGHEEISDIHLNYNNRYIKKKDGKYFRSEILLDHKTKDGEYRSFPIEKESDGSKRMINLMPILFLSFNKKIVWIIDELDRSLHTLLAKKFIELFLQKNEANRGSQLIFTTHDIELMQQDILRRDEMWVVDRKIDNSSSIIAISDFKDIKSNEDLKKSYLSGRFGGIPIL